MGDDVVVTGLGVVAPGTMGLSEFWRNALAGRVVTTPLRRFRTDGLQSTMGGEIHDFDPKPYFQRIDPNTVSLSTQFAVAAARLCIETAAVADSITGSDRVGVCFGSVSSCRPGIESSAPMGGSEDPAPPARPVLAKPCQLSRCVAEEWRLSGPNLTITTACAAGNSAISWAADAIRSGRADAMIAGGADQLSYGMLGFFSRLRSLSADVVRPFDRFRTGLLLSEGAGALLLEKRANAERRGAKIYCRVAGYGSFADAFHMTAPEPLGRGAIRSMREALRMAEVQPDDVGFVSAHGTGTPANDAVEAKALNAVFGGNSRPPVSSLKSLIGHTQGAASAIEAVACILTLYTGVIHPTANVNEMDPACDVDLVTAPRQLQTKVALNNSFGFGGNISCVVFCA